MKATAAPSAALADSVSAIKCVIIYEDFATGAHGKHFAEMLAEQLGVSCDCESLWRAELVEFFPEIGDEAAGDAAASDFVILALRGDRDLSFGFKRWIESWLATAVERGCSVIALFDPGMDTQLAEFAARCYLRETCAGAGVAFFACQSSSGFPSPEQRRSGRVVIEERAPARVRTADRQRRRAPIFS